MRSLHGLSGEEQLPSALLLLVVDESGQGLLDALLEVLGVDADDVLVEGGVLDDLLVGLVALN